MRTLEFTRSAIWPLILGCWVGMGFPAAADPPPAKSPVGNAAPSPAPPNGVGSQFELTYWNSVSDSEDRHQLEAYLAQYPNGTFNGLARAKIAALDRRGASNATQDSSLTPAAGPVLAAVAPPQPESAGTESAGTNSPAVTEVPVSAAVDASTPAPAPASAPRQSTMSPSLGEQLRALGQSQGPGPKAAPSAPLDQCVKSS